MNGTAPTPTTSPYPALRRTPVRTLSALTIAAGLVLAAPAAVSAAGADQPHRDFGTEGTLDEAEISFEDFTAEQEHLIYISIEGGPAARGVESLVHAEGLLGEELDFYLLPQEETESGIIDLGTDAVEEHYTINIHQENVAVNHVAQVRVDESFNPGQYWLVAYTSGGEAAGWQSLQLGQEDLSEILEYQGDQKTRSPKELHASLTALAEAGEGEDLLDIFCADPDHGHLCESSAEEPSPSQEPQEPSAPTDQPSESASPSALPSETPESDPASSNERLADTGFGVLTLGLVAAGLLTLGIFFALRNRDNSPSV